MSAQAAIGVAGWSYADWRGVVYPRGCRDELAWLSRYVDCIEINLTFYRLPKVEVVATWAARVGEREGFFFTAKIPQDVTHRDGSDVRAIAQRFADVMAPLRAAGMLRALLVQFSHRFVAGEAAYAKLAAIAASFGAVAPLVLEVRHSSWCAREAWSRARDLGYVIAALDYPGADRGFDGADAAAQPGAAIAYFRLHGRNQEAWFRKDAGRDEVYDWVYDAVERDELVARVREIAAAQRAVEQAAATIVVANNHFRGAAVKLALELRAARDGAKVAVPDALLAAYPDLRAVAAGVLF